MVQCALHNGLMEDKPQEGSFGMLIHHLSQTLEDPRVVVGRIVSVVCVCVCVCLWLAIRLCMCWSVVDWIPRCQESEFFICCFLFNHIRRNGI